VMAIAGKQDVFIPFWILDFGLPNLNSKRILEFKRLHF